MHPGAAFVFGGGIAAGLAATAVWLWRRSRPDSAERERRRRAAIEQGGRLVDGQLTDVQGEVVFYSYSLRGVGYAASQDLSALREGAPRGADLAGPVTVKYSPKNPANSIVLSERWSGFNRSQRRQREA